MRVLSGIVFVVMLLVTGTELCAEEYQLGNAGPQVRTGDRRIDIIGPNGVRLLPDVSWPSGYSLRPDGSVSVPGNIVVLPDGHIVTRDGVLPEGVLPEGFSRRADGAIVTPDGVALKSATIAEPVPGGPDVAAVSPAEQPANGAPQTVAEGNRGGVTVSPGTQPPAVVVPPSTAEATPNVPAQPAAQRRKEIWEMLPLTPNHEGEGGPDAQVADAASPKPAPEKKKTPKTDTLSIPHNAARQNDLSFLEGCWQTDELPGYFGVWDDQRNPGRKTIARICFNTKGHGQILYYDGDVCKGGAQANFAGEKLHINTGEAPCEKGNFFVQRQFECRGAGDKTQCFVTAYGKAARYSKVRFKKR